MKKFFADEFITMMTVRNVKRFFSFHLYFRFSKFKFFCFLKIFKIKFFRFMNKSYFVPFDFFKWVIFDFFKFFANKKNQKPYFYGIQGFLGMYGSGKTITMVHKLNDYRKFYGDKIYIFTNFNYKFQTAPISDDFNEFFKMYDKPVIFCFDEIQNYFNASVRSNSDFVNFNTILTQVRKGNGKLLLWSAQHYDAVNRQIRLLTTHLSTCTTRLSRIVFVNVYPRQAYEDRLSRVRLDNIVKVKSSLTRSFTFVQSNYLRSCYNSFSILNSGNLISKNFYGYNKRKILYKIVSKSKFLVFKNRFCIKKNSISF